jgi:phage terminase large subunit-like protein
VNKSKTRSKRCARSRLGEERASAVIQFIETCCRHTKGRFAGDPFILAPWQRDYVAEVFGNVNARSGLRRTRTAFLSVARKNGKSELAAAIALYMLAADGEQGPEVYGAAFDRDQASIVFDVAAQMVRQSEPLRNKLKVIPSTKRILCPDNGGFYRAIPADAAGSHGFNASCVIFDEVHTQRTRELWDVLVTSMGARDQPLVFAITTAGHNRLSLCYQLHTYATQVITRRVKDPSFVARVYEMPEGLSFEEIAAAPDAWAQANPSLASEPGGFLKVDHIAEAIERARHITAEQNTVCNLYFNQWTQSAERWFSRSQWDACGAELLPDVRKEWAGRECYGGLDLASTRDFNAFVLTFPRDDGGYDVLPRFWLPEVALEREDMAPMRPTLEEWRAAGFLSVTPGDVSDYDAIKEQIERDAEVFDLREVGYDRFLSLGIVMALADEGLTMVPVGQGYQTLSAPSKLLETLVADSALHHYGNPVLRWMADNVVRETRDYDEAIKPSRKKSTAKIDGIAALVDALERAMHTETAAEVAFYAFD